MSTPNQLPLTNVVNISVSQAQPGVGAYNTSNLALFTDEPFANSFGTLGYAIYESPLQVGVDFGTSSQTYAMALAVFSQQPNILAGGGSLVVIPFVVAVQTLAFSGVAASGTFEIVLPGGTTAAINWNDPINTIQQKVQAVSGATLVTVTGSIASELLTLTFYGVYGPVSTISTAANSLMTSAPAAIVITPASVTAGETLAAAITRTENLVQYFGLMGMLIFSQTDLLAAAAVIQALNKIAFFVSQTSADFSPGGMLDLLRTGDFTQSRGLYYGSGNLAGALGFMASYASRGLSVDFSGSNTTTTMHLKTLSGVQPDTTMTQTLLTAAQAAGVDVYVSLAGVAKVFCSGLNSFFDDVYNLEWFVGALQVAGFNYLAESSTKIPQTEAGMDGLKSAYRAVCEQAVSNGYLAPNVWNGSTTFGNQQQFTSNIQNKGYYIFSSPIAQQSQTDRVARKAPLVQIAAKDAGAVHSSNVIVFVNQ